MDDSPRFEVLRQRNFALLLVRETVSTLGTAMASVAIAFAVYKQVGGPTDLGLVILAREIPLVALLLLGGVWADRLSRRRLLISVDAVRGGTQLASAILLLGGHATLWNLAALQAGYGIAEAFSRPAVTGFIRETVSADQLRQANALRGLATSGVRIAGPAIGATIVAAAAPGWAIAADAGSFCVGGALLVAMRIPPSSPIVAGSVLADLREGWQEFRTRTWVWAMVSSFGFFQLSLFPALLVLGPFVAKHDLGGAGAWGAILAAQAAGAVFGGLVAFRVRFERPLAASALFSLPSAGVLAALALKAPLPAIAAAAFAAGTGLAIDDTLWFTTLQEKIPAHAISRISSFDWFGSVVLNPIGYALIGPLASATGVSAALAVAAIANATVSVALLSVPAVRSLRAGPEPTHIEELR